MAELLGASGAACCPGLELKGGSPWGHPGAKVWGPSGALELQAQVEAIECVELSSAQGRITLFVF